MTAIAIGNGSSATQANSTALGNGALGADSTAVGAGPGSIADTTAEPGPLCRRRSDEHDRTSHGSGRYLILRAAPARRFKAKLSPPRGDRRARPIDLATSAVFGLAAILWATSFPAYAEQPPPLRFVQADDNGAPAAKPAPKPAAKVKAPTPAASPTPAAAKAAAPAVAEPPKPPPSAPAEPQPLVHATQAGVKLCLDGLARAANATIDTQHTAMSQWFSGAADSHVFQSIVTLAYPTKVAPHAATILTAAPTVGNVCDTSTVEIFPTTRPCNEILGDLLKKGKVVADLSGLPVTQSEDGKRQLLMPTAGNGCVLVAVGLTFGK